MTRYSTTTTADPITYELDEAKLGQPVAEVIRQEIAAAIRAIPADAKGHRPFNATGHLVTGLRIELIDGAWAVTVPADRLESPELMARLVELVPMIADPTRSPRVMEAIAASADRLVS